MHYRQLSVTAICHQLPFYNCHHFAFFQFLQYIDWILGEYTNTNEALTKMINRPLDDQRANLALIITDGQPSINEIDWKKIQLQIGRFRRSWISLVVMIACFGTKVRIKKSWMGDIFIWDKSCKSTGRTKDGFHSNYFC